MANFLKLLWKKKSQWQVWVRIFITPLLLPLVLFVLLGKLSDDFIIYLDTKIPKAN